MSSAYWSWKLSFIFLLLKISLGKIRKLESLLFFNITLCQHFPSLCQIFDTAFWGTNHSSLQLITRGLLPSGFSTALSNLVAIFWTNTLLFHKCVLPIWIMFICLKWTQILCISLLPGCGMSACSVYKVAIVYISWKPLCIYISKFCSITLYMLIFVINKASILKERMSKIFFFVIYVLLYWNRRFDYFFLHEKG